MRVAIYIRVSTDEQAAEGYSIAAQHDRLVAYCQSQEWTIYGVYTEEGQSAKNTERPELKRLIKDAENGLFDIVLVYKLDRLTRSVLDLYSLLQAFERHNVKFKSATELYDTTTAMGKLFITLVAALAQWERENLAERVRVGMEQMLTEGKRPGGPIPYGYDKELKVIEDEGRIIRELRRLYMEERMGFYSIAKTLNARGLRRRNNSEWSSFTVYSVLDNPFYAGKLRWGAKNQEGKYVNRKIEDNVEFIIADSAHEVIFTWDEYEEHRERMRSREFSGYSKKTEYWFVGMLRCGKCGAAMTGRVRRNPKRKDGVSPIVISYICSNKQLRGTCKMPLMRQELIEKLFLEELKKRHDNLADVKSKALETKETPETERYEAELENLSNELRRIKDRKRKWQNLLIDELITQDEYQERILEDRQAEQIVSERLTIINNHKLLSQKNDEDSDHYFGALDMWDRLDDREKNELARTIFRTMTVHTPIESKQGLARKGKFLPASITFERN